MGESEVPESAIVRLRGRSGHVAGTGFLVTAELFVTCAHVVSAATGGASFDVRPPGEPVTVEFPLLPGGAGVTVDAVVVGWTPERPDGSGDIAVLRLNASAPAGARPARLTVADPRWGDEVRVFGFPADLPENYGTWVGAEVRARQGAGLLQVDSAQHGHGIEPGFSGSPVWSAASRGVVGMVVATEVGTGSRTGYLLPTRALIEAHPDIAAPDPGEVCPYRGLDPFLEEHAAHFRGRGPVTDRLVAATRRHPLVMLAGPSGSGKSSLVYAGLLPRLRERGTLVADFRPVPGMRSAALLATAVMPVLEPRLRETDRYDEARVLAERLESARESTLPWLAGRLADQAGPGGLLVVADQFEEIATPDARELFGLMYGLVRAGDRRADGSPTLLAALTLRSGTLDALVTEDTADAVRDGVVFVPPMSRAQLRAAVTAADVDFESGLVNRILDDAGTEPGHLPLVEFTLERLWARRSAGTLTHQAYEELGGVSGALARYAEDVYRNALTGPEQAAAQRLLVQLARPETDGGFVRRSIRLSDLDGEVRAVLGRLAASRLVVVGRSVDGAEIVDLAHHALLQRWARLRGWLVAERDFLTWKEQLRSNLAQWEAARRDPGGLLRGAALATATTLLNEHPGDIATAEREYIRASRAREQRRIRVLRSVVAVISVLALVAASLAAFAVWQRQVAESRLRTSASRALAEDANRFRGIDPAMALQLAQAAWHHDHTPEAYGALFAQYAALQPVEKLFENLWQGEAKSIAMSADGSAAVVTNGQGLPAVWTGLNGNSPQPWKLPTGGREYHGGTFQLSRSGQLLAYANDDGGVLLWDVEHHTGPVELAVSRPAGDPRPPTVKSMSFSPDADRLLVHRATYGGEHPSIEVWDVQRLARVAATNPIPPDAVPDVVSFGPNRDTVLVQTVTGVDLYDLGSGRPLRSFSPPERAATGVVAENGAVVVQCYQDQRAGGARTLHVIDVASGTEQRSIPAPSCASFGVDSSGGYVLFFASLHEGDSNAQISVADLRSGKAFRAFVPPMELNDYTHRAARVTVVAGANGPPVAFIADKNLLYRMPLTAPADLAEDDELDLGIGSARVASPRADVVASVASSGRIDLVDAGTNATIASVPGVVGPGAMRFQGQWLNFTPDGNRLVIVQGDALVVYSIPGLVVEHRVPLPVPANLGPPPSADNLTAWASSIVPVRDDQAIVLHAGVLTRWDLNSGVAIGSPVPLRADPAGQRRSALLAFAAGVPRAGHPGDVAVVEPSGAVEVWNLDQRRAVATAPADAASKQNSVLFDTTGTRLAVLSTNGQVTVWNLDENRKAGRPIPTGLVDGLLGFTPNGQVVTIESSGVSPAVTLWDDQSGKQLAILTVPANMRSWTLSDGVLKGFGRGQTRTVQLDPELWFAELCKASNRGYTDDEKPVLDKDNAGPEPPCR